MKIKLSSRKTALLFVFSAVVLTSQSGAEIQSSRIRTLGGMNYTARSRWNPKFNLLPKAMRDETYKKFGQNYFLEYDFVADSFSTYEGAMTDEKLGLNIGLSAEMDDNFVGKINKFSGYLGIKSLMLRLQSGKMRGSASWTGDPVAGMADKIDFDERYSDVSMVYWIGKAPFDYLGFSYISFGLPIQVDTMKTESDKTKQVYANPVYDKDFEAKIYAVSFGMDTLVTPMLFPDSAERSEFYRVMAESNKKSKGLGAYVSMQSLFGLGNARVSDGALLLAEAANPGRTAVDGKSLVGYVAMDLGFGLQYSIERKFSLGLGYKWSVTSLTPFGGGADNSTELGYIYTFDLLRHGPVLRAYLAF